ncbi:uncharacterized protein [Miscanthus floridulus]|uniref:uncharacterized protein n=1 Tax=Miscanthus floridulus TaxID=154761 RepID=UPI0034584D6A
MRVLMDGGSGLNILYIDTLDAMRIPWSELRPAGSPFHWLKMPGPNDVVTVSSAFSHAFMCDREHYELATAVVNSSELPWLGESSVPAAPNYNQPTSSSAFRPLEETKVVEIDPTNPTKIVRIRT